MIATTSSDEKAAKLKQLGADHVINYKSDPDWGKTAKSLTPNGVGVDHIIEVGGASTQEQSLNAIKPEGVITIIGFVGGAEGGPTIINALMHMCTIRGGLVGSVAQFEEMNAAIDANGIKPVVDEKVFDLKDLKESYEYMVSFPCVTILDPQHGTDQLAAWPEPRWQSDYQDLMSKSILEEVASQLKMLKSSQHLVDTCKAHIAHSCAW